MSYIEKISDLDTKLMHIRTIKDVCEKKIYLEVKSHTPPLLLPPSL